MLPRMRPLLLTVMPPPAVPVGTAARSMAVVRDEVTAPTPGIRIVFCAWISPALLIVFRVPLWSDNASDTRLKGAVEVAMFLDGATVLVVTAARMLAFW